ncbi:MAG: tetratricopeptide repeat protein [Woeseiaceae bacterium]|nr:tetratricopeptide repeat protein [Woeseiaceae bacterium]
MSLLCVLLASGNAWAQKARQESEGQDEQKTKQAQAVSKEVYDRIQKAQEMVDAKDYQGALRSLNSLYNPDKLTEYEQANVLNYIGFVYYNIEDMANAIRTYDRMLKIPSLEPQMAKQTTYTLAQLNMMEENYQKTLELLNKWFILESNPAPEPYILLAQVYYQLQRYQDMVAPIETAMDIARKRDKDVKEDWWVLLNFAYFQQENYAKVRDIQKILLENWPKKRYWFSLAGAYTELGEDQNLIAAYDAAYTQGMLEKESEFVTMAQLYLQREVPYKAAKLLEEKMQQGIVKKDEKNYRLLSQAWMLSQEDDKAIPALKEAARLSDDGELDVRLGNSYLNIGEYSDCVAAVRNGLRKGGLKSPDNAQISLGMCLYNLRQYDEAREAFRDAARVDKSRRIANQWIRVIDAEVERNRQIRLAQEAARKKREEVEARREAANRV